jgi:hypothetical protein
MRSAKRQESPASPKRFLVHCDDGTASKTAAVRRVPSVVSSPAAMRSISHHMTQSFVASEKAQKRCNVLWRLGETE